MANDGETLCPAVPCDEDDASRADARLWAGQRPQAKRTTNHNGSAPCEGLCARTLYTILEQIVV